MVSVVRINRLAEPGVDRGTMAGTTSPDGSAAAAGAASGALASPVKSEPRRQRCCRIPLVSGVRRFDGVAVCRADGIDRLSRITAPLASVCLVIIACLASCLAEEAFVAPTANLTREMGMAVPSINQLAV